MDEMKAINLTKKLAIVESDPKVVWNALEEVFGFGFFNPTIEEEFGITPAFKEQMTKQFNDELSKARNEANTKVNKLSGSIKNEIESFRKIIGRKNQEISQIMLTMNAKYQKSIDEFKEATEVSNKKLIEVQHRISFENISNL